MHCCKPSIDLEESYRITEVLLPALSYSWNPSSTSGCHVELACVSAPVKVDSRAHRLAGEKAVFTALSGQEVHPPTDCNAVTLFVTGNEDSTNLKSRSLIFFFTPIANRDNCEIPSRWETQQLTNESTESDMQHVA